MASANFRAVVNMADRLGLGREATSDILSNMGLMPSDLKDIDDKVKMINNIMKGADFTPDQAVKKGIGVIAEREADLSEQTFIAKNDEIIAELGKIREAFESANIGTGGINMLLNSGLDLLFQGKGYKPDPKEGRNTGPSKTK